MLPTAKVLGISFRATKCHFNCYGRLSWERSRQREIRENMLTVVEGPGQTGERGHAGGGEGGGPKACLPPPTIYYLQKSLK